ncbi:hypothetical protein SAY87_005099 [Trapa incisa]|uniref:NAC domain-containing protein n=1 Tax=Trapa incisa TaxID=236973 RepID=A0AAN7JQ67_9MYRT|nr:hypothetical protein SAY87_005099 [Trapa incisa]
MESPEPPATDTQQQPQLPPGFRFHPTDEELIVHYLKKKATSSPLPVLIIAEVDIYKFDPWELPAMASYGDREWYFFSPRDRKYPNGARPNRAATSGYWKATGTDKPIMSSTGNQKLGVKKALVFYGGKPPKGIKTNWIMHEYRLMENKLIHKTPGYDYGNRKNSLRLDDWVLCRIYKKNKKHGPVDHDKDDSSTNGIIESIGLQSPLLMGGHHQGLRFHGFPRPVPASATLYAPVYNHCQMFEAMIPNTGIGSSYLPLRSVFGMDPRSNARNSERFSQGNSSGSISSVCGQVTAAAANTSPRMGSMQPTYQLPGPNWYA